jgi:hypothetical protein
VRTCKHVGGGTDHRVQHSKGRCMLFSMVQCGMVWYGMVQCVLQCAEGYRTARVHTPDCTLQ